MSENMSITGTSSINYQTALQETATQSAANTAKSTGGFKDLVQESVVDQYKRKHPDHASHVNQQVRAGRAVRDRNGSGVSTENMSMAEYQAWFYALLDTIPYDSTRINDTTSISISDRGWEQMRKDPDYEAWILGYFVEDRSVRNPFFGWGNNEGCMIFERFGASIEEHRGDGFSKAALRGPDPEDEEDEEEDWWIKRHKRMKKLMREQVERSMKRDAAQKSAAREAFAKQQYLSRQRQHNFLTSGAFDLRPGASVEAPSASIAAAAAYGSILDLFGSALVDR